MARTAAGLSSREIAMESDLPQSNVAALISSARRTNTERDEVLEWTDILYCEARKRGMSVPALREKLIALICEDDLFEAVLDEGGNQ